MKTKCLILLVMLVNITKAQDTLKLSPAWLESEKINVSEYVSRIDYIPIEYNMPLSLNDRLYTGNDFVMFGKNIYWGNNYSQSISFADINAKDNCSSVINGELYYLSLRDSIVSIYKNGRNLAGKINLPQGIDRIHITDRGLLIGYRSRNIAVDDKGLRELYVYDIFNKELLLSHHSLSKSSCELNKQWFPFLYNLIWDYKGHIYYYENITQKVYEIVQIKDSGVRLVERFIIDMSPYAMSFDDALAMGDKDYTFGRSMHIMRVLEVANGIIFTISYDKKIKTIVFNKSNLSIAGVSTLTADLDEIASGELYLQWNRLSQRGKIAAKKYFRSHNMSPSYKPTTYIIPVYDGFEEY
ncbi:MAG: hypothetical protein IJJ94_07885 [Bacteroidaceae bacterium]|nr:hypothetical protein [Bacteroidaceae bacterium]